MLSFLLHSNVSSVCFLSHAQSRTIIPNQGHFLIPHGTIVNIWSHFWLSGTSLAGQGDSRQLECYCHLVNRGQGALNITKSCSQGLYLYLIECNIMLLPQDMFHFFIPSFIQQILLRIYTICNTLALSKYKTRNRIQCQS